MFAKIAATTALIGALLAPSIVVAQQPKDSESAKRPEAELLKKAEPVFWVDPGDIRSKDLFHGPGGVGGEPKLPLKYVKEDKGGTTPKFEVEDANGTKWKAKLGDETQPEVVASRILWAVGFAANTNYVIPETTIAGIETQQKRGRLLIGPGGRLANVRLQRTNRDWEKVGAWNWRDKRNKGRREFNGLRVMMAVLNNWDLKGQNNAIFSEKDDPSKLLFGTSDVGASFGMSGRSYTDEMTKNNVNAYAKHKFVSKVTKDYVDFNFPTHPSIIHIFMFEWIWYFQQMRNHWIGRHIPLEDARWVGSLLGQLSPQQIRDAFRAGNYTADETERFASALEARIAALQKL